MPDRGGQGQDALQDADDYPGGGGPAVSFQVELSFEGVVDSLDDLAQRLEEPGSGRFGFALAGGPQRVPAVTRRHGPSLPVLPGC